MSTVILKMYIAPEMLAYVGFKNPSQQLYWKVQVHIVKLMQNLMCVMSVVWVSKEWVRDCHRLIHSWTLYCDYWFTHSCNDCHCRCLRFGILIAVNIMILVFWDIMMCGSIDGYTEEPVCSSSGQNRWHPRRLKL